MRTPLTIALLLFHIWAQPLHATVVRELLPVDEAVHRPDFFSFRAGLLAAVGRRDAAAIRSVVHPNIRNTFGPDDGVQTFESTWHLDDPGSNFWSEFAAVLALGGKFAGPDAFVAPYTFAAWPDDLDGFEFVAMTGSDVRVRAAATSRAPSLGRVSFGILERSRAGDPAAGEAWTAVRWGQRTGFVSARYARSPTDYRAIFAFDNGRWWLTSFIAGD